MRGLERSALFLRGLGALFPRHVRHPRIAALPPGPFARLATLLGEVKPGKEPISLSIGDPSGQVPDFVKEALAASPPPASAIIPPSPERKIGGRRRLAGSTAALS